MDESTFHSLKFIVDGMFLNLRDVWGELLTQIEADELKALFLAELERHTEKYEGM